ncbi:MAG TPA: tetratricopeptide repeat protein [Pyrinomonadaceae bacterium]|jgi:tetratricopeptide (TPR) repeat protein
MSFDLRKRQSPLSLRPACVACAALLVACVLLLTVGPKAVGQSQKAETPGLAELKKGEYERAFQLLSSHLAANPSDAEAQRLLLRAQLETGRYTEAEAAARKFLEKNPAAGGVRRQLGEALAATGRYEEAAKEFERAATDAAAAGLAPAERLESQLRRAEMLSLVGQEEKAREIFQSFVTYYNTAEPESAAELTVVARALAHLERYKDASDLFMAAIRADPAFIEAHLGGGELFTEKYSYAEAAEFFEDALKINPNNARAHLGVAANKSLEGGAEMIRSLARALEINPNLGEARSLRARVELEAGNYEAAAAEIEKALKTNPRSLEAHALRAALLYLQDRDFEPEAVSALAINPRYGELYDTLSHFAAITRRTGQAAQFARRALQLSPRLWRAHLSLGIALLRLGRMEEGRAEVEASFKGDPFNVWAKNTLDLLDSMREYRETRRGPFLIRAAATESEVLAAYASDLLEEASTKLTTKYRFTPQGPITVELFPNHEDFAVRALGLPGLGALGVCFGQVIAQDSPSARPEAQFNWGSTLWHEYTHVITLQMTEYRIPRWFSEGLSVYEERRARAGWGDDWNAGLLRALAEGRWFKIADLDAAFMRPRRAEDVSLAYFQASQVAEFITDRYGFDAILRMLALYRDKARTGEVLRQALKLTEAEFDRAFMEYVEGKARLWQQALGQQPLGQQAPGRQVLGATDGALSAQMTKEMVLEMLRTQDTFPLNLRAGALYQAEGDLKTAARHFKRAADLFPYYTGPGNAYESLADIFEKEGDTAAAALALELLVHLDENNLAALRRLAQLRLKQGDRERALEALRLSFYISPFDSGAHAQAGELMLGQGDATSALREFQAALALQPPNQAEANYNVARAYYALGRTPDAKRAVLRALEDAPSYEQAQELLLKIVGQ